MVEKNKHLVDCNLTTKHQKTYSRSWWNKTRFSRWPNQRKTPHFSTQPHASSKLSSKECLCYFQMLSLMIQDVRIAIITSFPRTTIALTISSVPMSPDPDNTRENELEIADLRSHSRQGIARQAGRQTDRQASDAIVGMTQSQRYLGGKT